MNKIIFNKSLRIKHLDRCARAQDAHVYDYLRDHVAKDFCDRIDDLKSENKRLIFNLGSCSGLVAKNLNADRVDALIEGDISKESVKRSRSHNSMLPLRFPSEHIQCDEEYIPLRGNSIDMVTSCLTLHWVNDLVKCFKQVHGILKKESAFIGTIFGGDTLFELRSSLQLAELERLSGFSSHIAPKTTGQDVARLLQNCGFQLITVDVSEIKIYYPSMFELMHDLQGMGESNKSIIGSRHMHRDVLKAGAAVYQQLYGSQEKGSGPEGGEGEQGGVPATFQYIHFIGWKDPTKATPLRSQQN